MVKAQVRTGGNSWGPRVSARLPAPVVSGSVIVALYHGRCGACDEAIQPGQSIRYEDDNLIHADCEASAPVERPAVVCSTCHLTKPCGCEDPS